MERLSLKNTRFAFLRALSNGANMERMVTQSSLTVTDRVCTLAAAAAPISKGEKINAEKLMEPWCSGRDLVKRRA